MTPPTLVALLLACPPEAAPPTIHPRIVIEPVHAPRFEPPVTWERPIIPPVAPPPSWDVRWPHAPEIPIVPLDLDAAPHSRVLTPWIIWEAASIDGIDEIVVHRDVIGLRHVAHDAARGLTHHFLNELVPSGTYEIIVERVAGRGALDVRQHPTADNDYTAVIRIDDSADGSDHYIVGLHFRQVEAAPWLVWEAESVDGVDEIVIRGDVVGLRRVAHDAPRGVTHRVIGTPVAGAFEVFVQVIEGRGAVTVVQQPDASNGNETVIRLDDGAPPGAAPYRIEIWTRQRG